MKNYKNYFSTVGYIFVFLIFIEYLTVDYDNYYFRPSFYFKTLENSLVNLYICVGRSFAFISSFTNYFNFRKLFLSINNIFSPILGSLFSPLNIAKGYSNYINDNIRIAQFIHMGSVFLVLGIPYLLYKLNIKYGILNYYYTKYIKDYIDNFDINEFYMKYVLTCFFDINHETKKNKKNKKNHLYDNYDDPSYE